MSEEAETMPRPASKPATIVDVAREAGVSRSLVSLVLHNSPKVSEQKRRAVEDAIAALDYRPSNAARSLASGRTRTIGVLLEDLTNPWFVDLLDGLQSRFASRDLRMILGDPKYFGRPGESPVAPFLELRVDGLVLAGDFPADSELVRAAAGTPTVVAGVRSFDIPGADLVSNDDVEGARLAVEHLIGLGHRRIAYLNGTGGASELRRRSYLATMERHGLAPCSQVIATDMTEQSAADAVTRLIHQGELPTALFCANDVLAIGALSAAADCGVGVPERLSLVGYDNSFLAKIGHLSLTTIENVSYDVGARAADLLLARIADPAIPPRRESFTPRLIERRTTAPPPVPTAG